MQFKTLITDDATITIFDESYNEAMHSLSGAYQEAVFMHVIPSKVLEKHGQVHVLDIGFGLGYNVLALCYEAKKQNRDVFYSITSLEKNKYMVEAMECVHFNDDRDKVYELLKHSARGNKIITDYFSHSVLYGDARQLLSLLPENSIDAVFHDPFSPYKNPELWSVDFFKKLFDVCKDECIVTTYSAAVHVRVAMKKGGFIVGKGPQVGRKKEGTVATKRNNAVTPLGEEYFALLKNDPKAIPFTDPGLCTTTEEIRERRRLKMLQVKRGLQAP
ncbi:MAG: MnmC family methyltransferase [Spirochaetes bacterium]|nr:MnmC family methyltransferase [Spirochaetota bacterium]